MKRQVAFRVNAQPVELDTDDDRLLLWVLRTDLALTGTKYGCGKALCGACTVIIDGKASRSCVTSLKALAGKQVTTIEGLADVTDKGAKLHPLQQSFVDHGAFQCGYCTAGMLLSAAAFLKDTAHPTRAAIESHMSRNLCRCGAHVRIVDAIEAVANAPGAGS